jgi:hypothetical protein
MGRGTSATITGPQRYHAPSGCGGAASAWTMGFCFFTKLNLADSRQQLPPATGTGAGLGQVEDKFPVTAGPIRLEHGTFGAAGIVVTSDARLELGPDSRVGTFSGCQRMHAWSVKSVGPVHTGVYGRLFGPFADSQTASPGCGRGAGDLQKTQAVSEELHHASWEQQIQLAT